MGKCFSQHRADRAVRSHERGGEQDGRNQANGLSITFHTASASAIPHTDAVSFNVTATDKPLVLVMAPQDTVSLPAVSPVKLLTEFGIIPKVAIDPATDIAMDVSDDNGANYVRATLDPAVQFVTGQYLITGMGDVSAQSGKKPKLKITAAAGKHIEVDAGGGFWN